MMNMLKRVLDHHRRKAFIAGLRAGQRLREVYGGRASRYAEDHLADKYIEKLRDPRRD